MRKLISILLSVLCVLTLGSNVFLVHAEEREHLVGPQPNYEKPIMMAYYRTWRDVMIPHYDSEGNNLNELKMTDLPEEIDIVSVFHAVGEDTDVEPFFTTLKEEYVPTLHERGQKVVRTLDYNVLLKIKDRTGKDASSLTRSDYRKFAQSLIDEYMTPWNLDGLDVDMEARLSEEEVTILSNVIIELSDLLGIKENSDKLLIYDTNQNNHPLFKEIAPHISYLFIQAYGRPVEMLDTTWDTYKTDISSDKVLFGISFYEERDPTNWGDAIGEYEKSRAHYYAQWQPEGGEKGGMFVYAVDRDGKEFGDDTISKTDFAWTKKLVQTMQEAVKEKMSTILIEYRDSSGELLDSEELEAAYDSVFVAEAKEIKGYKLLSEDEVKIKVDKGTNTVSFVYEKIENQPNEDIAEDNKEVTDQQQGNGSSNGSTEQKNDAGEDISEDNKEVTDQQQGNGSSNGGTEQKNDEQNIPEKTVKEDSKQENRHQTETKEKQPVSTESQKVENNKQSDEVLPQTGQGLPMAISVGMTALGMGIYFSKKSKSKF